MISWLCLSLLCLFYLTSTPKPTIAPKLTFMSSWDQPSDSAAVQPSNQSAFAAAEVPEFIPEVGDSGAAPRVDTAFQVAAPPTMPTQTAAITSIGELNRRMTSKLTSTVAGIDISLLSSLIAPASAVANPDEVLSVSALFAKCAHADATKRPRATNP
jgi:hypothetical protein